MAAAKDQPDNMIISFIMLRRFTGVTGALLPVVLLLGCCVYCQQCRYPSISAYYHTAMRDIFVGTLFAIAIFLLFYKGYHSGDHRVSIWAGISALCVALFETDPPGTPVASLSDILHYISAVSFFLALIVFCFFLFTKTNPAVSPTGRKLLRNRIYRICGFIMVACLLAIPLYSFWLKNLWPGLTAANPVFWLETVLLWAFGVSWMVKGEMVLADT